MSRGSPELVSAKIAYVKDTVTANKSLLMFAVAKIVKERFGESLAPDKLREAFLEAGGTIQPRRRSAATLPVAGSVDRLPGSTPERRRVARRGVDRQTSTTRNALGAMEKHIVVVKSSRVAEVHEFSTSAAAKQFITGKLVAGASTKELAFYSRETLGVTVGV